MAGKYEQFETKMKRGIKLKMKKKYESTRNIKFNIQTIVCTSRI